jgi:hypothetical protein
MSLHRLEERPSVRSEKPSEKNNEYLDFKNLKSMYALISSLRDAIASHRSGKNL